MGAPNPPKKAVKREQDAAVLAQVEDDGDENTLIIKFKPGQKQNNDSLIALNWCLTYGVLPIKEVPDALVRLEKLKAEHKANLDNRPTDKK
ncbi:Hypothetical Protein FCC1311_035832 [Hondaea fermentalgiana]|uniref:Uncharacterized protein n=1 Tax=Hondaea fermentalgiana TaxID=2315210 RepID=A0A2R5GGH3_9STRA|nr:Hypothetical Protein FCC1311_035832 [Hondaea fermentalgiana]|eukprot:GBG27361.1 Hypothetical Protein FCC1311_035832 [Hondaea fermentalgiana]